MDNITHFIKVLYRSTSVVGSNAITINGKVMRPNDVATSGKVLVTNRGVRAFNKLWPNSRLRETRAYWFEFDSDGELIDMDCPSSDDGLEAAAMAGDCYNYLANDTVPQWLDF